MRREKINDFITMRFNKNNYLPVDGCTIGVDGGVVGDPGIPGRGPVGVAPGVDVSVGG